MSRPAIFLLACLAFAACGEAYRLEPAKLLITDSSTAGREDVIRWMGPYLTGQGFEDLGLDHSMADFLRSTHQDGSSEDYAVLRENQRTFLDRKRDLRITATAFGKGSAARKFLSYTLPEEDFLEISIMEQRPGGFSPQGHLFHEAFLAELSRQTGAEPLIVAPPPPTNEAEYRRITLTNRIGGAIAWGIAYGIGLLLSGPLTAYVLRRRRLSLRARRSWFIPIVAWISMPIPAPATIMVVPAPNLIAFPWLFAGSLYSINPPFILVSAATALILTTAIAFAFLRPLPDTTP